MHFNVNMLCDNCNNITIKTFHSKIPPQKREYREHHHTECELSLFISGSGLYSVHGITYEFQPGDIFLFGSNEAHCITEVYENLDLLNIHFEPKLLWEHPETIDLLNIFVARNKSFRNKFTDQSLQKLILDLETELYQKHDCYKIQVRCILFSALVHILRNYDYIDSSKIIASPSSVTNGLKKAINYINENLVNNLTLKDIAAVACMTQTYFSAIFKKYNGISPWEYITIKRVEKSIELLKSTDKTKLEIAELSGFQSSSNFYKTFKKITGKHPNDFK